MTGFISDRIGRIVAGNPTIPVTLGLRNIYILPTGYGWLYLTGVAAMLIGSINYHNNLGFLLTFLLGSLGFTALLHTYGMLYGLRLIGVSTAPVFAGEFMTVAVTVADTKRPRRGLRWTFHSDPVVAVNLTAEKRTPVQIPVQTGHRGWFSPPRLHIACDYPLGLFRAWSRINTNVREVVYPHPLTGPAPGIERPTDRGEDDILGGMGTDDFMGLTAYQPGDPPQRIHWQAYSRGRGLFVKQFAGRANAGTLLDIQRIQLGDVEHKLSILCFHVLRAHRHRLSVGLKLNGHVIAPDRGKAHRDRCLRALAFYGRQ